jgi:hypothetical protein
MNSNFDFPYNTIGTDVYPDEFVSTSVKQTDQWGLQYFLAAWGAQERSESFSLDSRVARYVSTRKLAEGLASLESIKKLFDQDVDLTFLNVNEMVSTPLPKILTIATRTVYNQPYQAMAIPVDSTSVSKTSNKRNTVMAKMALEQERLRMENLGVKGIIDESKEVLPKDNEELDIHMQMNPKIGEAIAMEYFIRQGRMRNNVDDIEKKVARDLVNLKIGITRTYLDSDLSLIVDYIDPVNFMSSFVNEDDFNDAKHMGQVMRVPISDLREMMNGKYPERDIKWIAENMTVDNRSGWRFGEFKYYDTKYRDQSEYDQNLIQVVHLEVKQFDRRTYVKKHKDNGGFFFEKRSPQYTIEEGDKSRELVHSGAIAFYEGYWVVGSDYIFDWHRKDDAWRDRLNGKWSSTGDFTYTVVAPNIYDMENKSITERCRYYDEQYKLLELKRQQFIITADPPGNEYDIDKIGGAIKGMGDDDMGPMDVINIKTQTGRLITSSKDENGDLLPQAAAVKKIESGIDQSLLVIEELQQIAIGKMKDIAGVNEAVDGTQPDKKTLVGALEIAAEGHKASIADLQWAFQKIFRETSKKIYRGYQYQILNGVNIDEMEASLGEMNIEEVKLADLSKADFDIGIEMMPTQSEHRDFKERLAKLAEAGLIPPEDEITIARIAEESLLKAEQMLKYKAKKFREEQAAAQQQNIQLQNEGLAMVAQTEAQTKAKLEQQKIMLEGETQKQKYDLEDRNMRNEWVEKSKFEMLQTENKLKLIEKASQEKKGENREAEDRKFEHEKAANSSGGYDLERDSLPRVAGPIEPSLGLPGDLGSSPNVEQGTTAES